MMDRKIFKNKDVLRAWSRGSIQAFPIVLGYIPVGFAYGVLAQKAGISALNTLLMSIVVFAGSSQLIAIGLISSGLAPLSIILTTFVVNLRHMLMSAALSPFLQKWEKIELSLFAFQLTDETFALHSTRVLQAEPQKGETLAVNVTAQAAWILGSWFGIVAGRMITEIEPFALDYALPAMFIALLVMQIKNHTQVVVAVLAGTLSIVFYRMGFNQWHVIIATIIGATLGVLVEKWIKN
jgi:4-azaleucine resistance transporter AzlC